MNKNFTVVKTINVRFSGLQHTYTVDVLYCGNQVFMYRSEFGGIITTDQFFDLEPVIL